MHVLLIVILGAVVSLSHHQHDERPLDPDVQVIKPVSAIESGIWVSKFHSWIQEGENKATSEKKPSLMGDCAEFDEPGVRYFSAKPYWGINGLECILRTGEIAFFPAFELLTMGSPGKCNEAIKLVRDEVEKHRSVVNVTLNGVAISKEAYWRNLSDECFPLDTGWTGFGVKNNDEPMEYLSSHYSDGYWLKLRFMRAGEYRVRITNAPHRLFNWERSDSKDISYLIKVVDDK